MAATLFTNQNPLNTLNEAHDHEWNVTLKPQTKRKYEWRWTGEVKPNGQKVFVRVNTKTGQRG